MGFDTAYLGHTAAYHNLKQSHLALRLGSHKLMHLSCPLRLRTRMELQYGLRIRIRNTAPTVITHHDIAGVYSSLVLRTLYGLL